MKFAKSILTGTGAVVLAGLILALLAPRAAHAIAATAVQVENTRSTPVPNQDVDIAARHPYTAQCVMDTVSGFSPTCYPSPAPPAIGFETVIQSVNMRVAQLGIPNAQPTYMELNYFTANNSFQNFVPFTLQSPTSGYWVGSQLTAIYLDPGSSLLCQAYIPSGAAVELVCTVTGYTVALP
jgi:hypothetical protein